MPDFSPSDPKLSDKYLQKHFDKEWYLKRYPKVKEAGIDPIEHYKKNGYKEGRFISAEDELRPVKLFYEKYGRLPLKQNKIVFENFSGNGFGCNPKYIALEIIRRKLPYDLVWLVKDKLIGKRENFPREIRLVDFDSEECLKEHATAKIWISNYRKYPLLKRGLRKKDKQIYIQTWHGSLGIKRLDADVEAFNVASNLPWLERSKYESSVIDYLIINSTFEQNILPHALWLTCPMKMYGHARNDIFFGDKKEIVHAVRNYYKLEDQKILLYVPTFRDDNDLSWHNIDYLKILNRFEEKFESEFVFFVRMHPRLSNKFKLIPEHEKIINVTNYMDIQELLVAADCAITDYSSTIYDFVLTGRPGFIYAPDLKKFNSNRGFYYTLEETPFPVAQNNDQLTYNIENFNPLQYDDAVEAFLKGKGCMEDGSASERIVDLLETLIADQKEGKS